MNTVMPTPSASSRLTTEQAPSQLSEPRHAEHRSEEQAQPAAAAESAPQQRAEQEQGPASTTAPDQPTPPPPPPMHRLKHVQLPGGRGVPVVMQSENGPCPLLAIANVLLLRGNITLPAGASEVSQVLLQLTFEKRIMRILARRHAAALSYSCAPS